MHQLGDRRAAFVGEYMIDFNASRAALAAGFAHRTYGYQLLCQKPVRAEIAARMADEERRITLDGDHVARELMRVAFSDIRRFVRWDKDGFALTPSDELLPDDSAAVAMVVPAGARGGPRIRLHRKRHALRALARRIGLEAGRDFVDPAMVDAAAAALREALLRRAGLLPPLPALPRPAGSDL